MIKKMDQDFENEYFQQYSIFSNGENHPFTIEQDGHSQNSFLVEMREPLSLQCSDNNNLEDFKEEMNLEPTKACTKTSDIPVEQLLFLSASFPKKPFFDEMARLKYKAAFQGSKDDTMELNINFKTLLVNYFKELILANELSPFQIRRINQFSSRVPSFNSLKELFHPCPQNEGIRGVCLNLFSSSECIRKVMSGRSKLKTKIQMVKYIQKVRLNILNSGETIKWKDVIKKEDS